MVRRQNPTLLMLLGLVFAQPSSALTDTPALAQRADLDLDQLQHTAYGPNEGAPPYLVTMRQDKDGFLWITGGDSPIRFDGVRFDYPYDKLLQGYPKIFVQFVDSGGNLWLGHIGGGISMIAGGKLHHTDPGQNGLPAGSVFDFVQDGKGVVWAISVGGVVRWVGDRWLPVDSHLGYPGKHPEMLFKVRSTGKIYLQDAEGTYVLRPDASLFETTHEDLYRLQTGLPPSINWSFDQDKDSDALLDRGGALWVVGESGIDRFRWPGHPPGKLPPRVEHFSHAKGLTADTAQTLLEDREGDLWVSTTKGLDRFRVPALTPVVLPGTVDSPGIAITDDGHVWLANRFQSPLEVDGTHIISHPEWGDGGDSAIYADSDGLWMAGSNGLRHSKNGKVQTIATPTELAHVGTRFRAITRDAQGHLWVAISTYGVYRIVDGRWQNYGGRTDLPEESPNYLARDARGRIWLAYSGDRLAVIDGVHLTMYTRSNGLAVGDMTHLSFRDGSTWVAGSRGVALLENGRFRSLHAAHEDFIHSNGVVQTTHGDLWIQTDHGIFQIDRTSVLAWSAHNEANVAFRRFDSRDGIDGASDRGRGPSLVEASNHRLWLSGNGGIAFVDTDHVLTNNIAPKPLVQNVTADGVDYPAVDSLTLPPLTEQTRIKFTAPSLRMPDRVRLEYRLQGFDSSWQDAGPEREAVYTRLAPGSYGFEVRAFNEDGVPSVRPAELHFVLAPAWYQTWWFRTACFLMALALFWLLHRWRLGLAESRARAEQVGRAAERERIARDLHDTLLQGVQGMLLQLQASFGKETSPERMEKLRNALNHARASVVEARDKVASLRGEDSDDPALTSLADLGQELAATHSARFIRLFEGQERCLQVEAGEQLLQIGAELLRNAFVHARPQEVRLRVAYKRRHLILAVHDDGCGIAPGILAAGGSAGHWGLRGVRERAVLLKGKLRFDSVPGSTTAKLTVPASVAYRSRA